MAIAVIGHTPRPRANLDDFAEVDLTPHGQWQPGALGVASGVGSPESPIGTSPQPPAPRQVNSGALDQAHSARSVFFFRHQSQAHFEIRQIPRAWPLAYIPRYLVNAAHQDLHFRRFGRLRRMEDMAPVPIQVATDSTPLVDLQILEGHEQDHPTQEAVHDLLCHDKHGLCHVTMDAVMQDLNRIHIP